MKWIRKCTECGKWGWMEHIACDKCIDEIMEQHELYEDSIRDILRTLVDDERTEHDEYCDGEVGEGWCKETDTESWVCDKCGWELDEEDLKWEAEEMYRDAMREE